MSDDAEATPLPVLTERVDPRHTPPVLDAETARRIEVETVRALDLALKRFAVHLRKEIRREVAEILYRECRTADREGVEDRD